MAETKNTYWKYDEYSRVTNKTDHLGVSLFRYAYNANGLLTSRTSAAKGLTQYRYDPVGNLTNIDYSITPDITLAYDRMGRLTNMVDAVGTTRYAYDGLGQLLTEDGPWTRML
jgi:YD repeat-containing protein